MKTTREPSLVLSSRILSLISTYSDLWIGLSILCKLNITAEPTHRCGR